MFWPAFEAVFGVIAALLTIWFVVAIIRIIFGLFVIVMVGIGDMLVRLWKNTACDADGNPRWQFR